MGKRYKESTLENADLEDVLGLIITGSSTYKTIVKDSETGKTGTGKSSDRQKSIERAWKNLREKQGG